MIVYIRPSYGRAARCSDPRGRCLGMEVQAQAAVSILDDGPGRARRAMERANVRAMSSDATPAAQAGVILELSQRRSAARQLAVGQEVHFRLHARPQARRVSRGAQSAHADRTRHRREPRPRARGRSPALRAGLPRPGGRPRPCLGARRPAGRPARRHRPRHDRTAAGRARRARQQRRDPLRHVRARANADLGVVREALETNTLGPWRMAIAFAGPLRATRTAGWSTSPRARAR